MKMRFDAVVIGGGPAGALAAFHLARNGWRTALIEKRNRNGDKTCGHCLHRRGIEVLRRNRLERVAMVARVADIDRWRLHVPGRRMIDVSIEPDINGPASIVVRRDRFDQLLIDEAAKAGAMVYQPASAAIEEQKIIIRRDGDIYPVRANLIVGADGLRSRVARLMNNSSYQTGGKFGFSFDIPNGPADIAGRAGIQGALDMYVFHGGYVGIVREHAGFRHVGGLLDPALHQGPSDPIECLHQCADLYPELKDGGFGTINRDGVKQLRGAGPIPWRPKRIAAAGSPGVALVGDAAGFTEPFTGEGMCWAVESAEVFGSIVKNRRGRSWTDENARAYEAAHRSMVQRRQRISRLASSVIESKPLATCAVGAAHIFPFLLPPIVRRVMCA